MVLAQSAWSANVLVVHSACTCTNPAKYGELYQPVIHPYWSNDPPKHRLVNKPYKRIDDPKAFMPENTLLFKVIAPHLSSPPPGKT